MNTAKANMTKRYLRTGEYDILFQDWLGTDVLDRASRGSKELIDTLVSKVKGRVETVSLSKSCPISDAELAAFTRAKVTLMVRGFFPRKECEPVLSLLDDSVSFLTPDNIEGLIRREDLHTAWEIACIYLASIGAERISNKSLDIVGVSVSNRCYVSQVYFREKNPYEDFVVHEAAHVFHNTKRHTAGLVGTRHKQWLLEIDFVMRETFAYSCEAYSRILELSKTPADRVFHLKKLQLLPPPQDERVVLSKYFEILALAISRRSGWKAILEECSVKR